jgi:hypothetical protein
MQQSLFSQKPFLGGRAKGRKRARVFTTKKAMHFTLKARQLIQNRKRLVERELNKQAEHFGIRLYERSVNGYHLHVLLKAPSRASYRSFIRAFCGILARKMGKGMWKQLPYGRPVAWGKDFRNVVEYVLLNKLEAFGLVARRKRIPYWRHTGERLSFREDWAIRFRDALS